MKRHGYIFSVVACMLSVFGVRDVASAGEVERPALVVNIVVGGLPYDFIRMYGANLSDDGFLKFMREGMVFTSARYDYMPTNSVSSLATITTGTYPSVHGVVGEKWFDMITGEEVDLIEDPSVTGFDCDYGKGCYSNAQLLVPTLGDRLKLEHPESKVISVAANPVSSIVLAGLNTEAYWVNPVTATWTSSSSYMLYLPGWVTTFNERYKNWNEVSAWRWSLYKDTECYLNGRYGRPEFGYSSGFRKMCSVGRMPGIRQKERYANVAGTPLASDLLSDFIVQLVVSEGLGDDDIPDILNICFDAPRDIISHYGPESVEAEDMFYQLDWTIGALVRFIESHVGNGRVLFVLTSDHGTSGSYDATGKERFDGDQFCVITNSFLGAQYGGDKWVAGYANRRLYINRSEAFSRKLPLEQVQRLTSDFALQMRDVSRVVPSCDLRIGGAGDVYMERLCNGYFPKRSGDLLIDLAPGVIDIKQGVRASAGSAYDYDVHVPLIFLGCGIPAGRVDGEVDMAAVPVTLARLLGVGNPEAATAVPIEEIVDCIR